MCTVNCTSALLPPFPPLPLLIAATVRNIMLNDYHYADINFFAMLLALMPGGRRWVLHPVPQGPAKVKVGFPNEPQIVLNQK